MYEYKYIRVINQIGIQQKTPQKTAAYTDVFATSLINIAEVDRSVCGITAAMPGNNMMMMMMIMVMIVMMIMIADYKSISLLIVVVFFDTIVLFLGGTGLDKFGRRFPKRTFDVGK